MKLAFRLFVIVSALIAVAQAQGGSPDDRAHIEPRKPVKTKEQHQPQGESSSRDSLISKSGGASNAGLPGANNDTQELLPYDPHKAAKDIEVGEYYLKHKNYRAALERFNHALLYKPRDADATYRLAQTQDKMDLTDPAYRNYQIYLEVFPGGPFAKDAQEAIRRLAPRVIASNQSNADPDFRQKIEEGEALLAANDFQEAHSSFARAVEIAPSDPLANLRLGQALVGLQRLDEARIYFQKCLELHPSERDAAEAKRGIAKVNDILGK
ncbi:MAG TPA: tetratricopeptide repeat protein [Candidatus Saccharimonadales bacterium]|jgi:tetratricopeptide (TPR) repeat protein|nr:tetratricopeptide repeat protein [Candidatus Saccharimonadales bacterium]